MKINSKLLTLAFINRVLLPFLVLKMPISRNLHTENRHMIPFFHLLFKPDSLVISFKNDYIFKISFWSVKYTHTNESKWLTSFLKNFIPISSQKAVLEFSSKKLFFLQPS